MIELAESPYKVKDIQLLLATLSPLEKILEKRRWSGGPWGVGKYVDPKKIAEFVLKERISALSVDQQVQYLNAVVSVNAENSSIVAKTAVQDSKSLIVAKPVAESVERQILIHGGMVGPHLHHEGKIYKLTADQWSKFTSTALDELRSKLSQVKAISFDSFIKVAEAVEEVI